MLAHPNLGMSCAASTPPSTDPNGKPQYINATMFRRNRFGENSDVIAMMIGSAPPSPKPVTRRTVSRPDIEWVSGVANDPNASTKTEKIRTGFRPKRSPAWPTTRAPISPLNRLEPNTGPKAAAGTCQSEAMAGATNPIACVSIPSIIAIRAQRPMMVDENAVIFVKSRARSSPPITDMPVTSSFSPISYLVTVADEDAHRQAQYS